MTQPFCQVITIRVEANALEYATRGVLLMKCEEEKWRPVITNGHLLICELMI